jgi:hypothetical protein
MGRSTTAKGHAFEHRVVGQDVLGQRVAWLPGKLRPGVSAQGCCCKSVPRPTAHKERSTKDALRAAQCPSEDARCWGAIRG